MSGDPDLGAPDVEQPSHLPVQVTGNRVRAGSAARRFREGDARSLLEAYLTLIRGLRDQRRARTIELRSTDIDALAAHLVVPGTSVVEQLADLMGATRAQRLSMATLFSTGALVIGLAGSATAAAPGTSHPGGHAAPVPVSAVATTPTTASLVPAPSTAPAAVTITSAPAAAAASTAAAKDAVDPAVPAIVPDATPPEIVDQQAPATTSTPPHGTGNHTKITPATTPAPADAPTDDHDLVDIGTPPLPDNPDLVDIGTPPLPDNPDLVDLGTPPLPPWADDSTATDPPPADSVDPVTDVTP